MPPSSDHAAQLNPASIGLVIFDMDGVIFDTERLAIAAWREAAAKFGYELSAEAALETVGLCPADAWPVHRKHFGDAFPFERVLAERRAISRRQSATGGVPVKKGLADLLDVLRSLDKKTALATSTERKRTLELLERAGVAGSFSTIVCGDDVAARKPAPDIYRAAAGRAGVAPPRCLVIEDSDVGIIAAHAAGMITVFVQDVKPLEPATSRFVNFQFEDLGSLGRELAAGAVRTVGPR